MKKLIILLIIFILCGCSGRILKDEPTEVEYVTKLVELGYSQSEAEIADKFSDELKEKLLIEYDSNVKELLSMNDSENLINYYLENKDSDLIEFTKDKFFILKNIDLYKQYKDEFADTRSLIEYVNSKAYKKPFEEAVEADTTKGLLMIGSKIYYLGNYEPADLQDVDKGYYILSTPKLRSEALKAYIEMSDAARSEGLDFYISTAYRSYDFQNNLYNSYLKNDPQEVVDTYSSRPGYSDHQIGLSCDIRTEDKAFGEFTSTKEAEWLKNNAYKFGFINRYPEGKENITGYMYESWHYRYVGKDVAKIIYDNNITFDEYYAYYVE